MSISRKNSWLTVIFAILCIAVIGNLVLAVISVPTYYQRAVTGTIPDKPPNSDYNYPTNESFAASAAMRGMSLPAYVAYSIAVTVLPIGVSIVVVTLLLIRAKRNWFLWFTALLLLFFPLGNIWRYAQVAGRATDFLQLIALLWPSFPLWLFLFPNGRAVPRRALWLVIPLALVHFGFQAAYALAALWAPAAGLPAALEPFTPLVQLQFPVVLVCQIYRYLRVSTPVERQQTKWFVVGLACWFIASAFGDAPTSAPGDVGFTADLAEVAWIFMPLSIGIAILRYRLFDIDVIIRRTLIYSVLSAVLGGMYFGLVVILQGVLRALTGQASSNLVTVVSTLAVAGLFLPLRNRIQAFIDRRFYRRKYNAEQAAALFSAEMRDVVEMDDIVTKLMDAVDDTLQPGKIVLWLAINERKMLK